MMDIQKAITDYNTTSGAVFRPKAVLFDMDGVLYDSMPHHAIAWQEAMARFGINMTAHDSYATEGARGFDTVKMLVKRQQMKSAASCKNKSFMLCKQVSLL